MHDDLTNSQLAMLIDEQIRGQNAERNRNILKRRIIDGIHFEPLAEEFDMSPRYIRSLVRKLSDRLKIS